MQDTAALRRLCQAAVLLLLQGCYSPRYVYSPGATNVPNLARKGDSKLAAYLSFSNPGSGKSNGTRLYNYGFDAQGAYALSNHWGVIAAHGSRYEKNSGDFSSVVDSAVIRYRRTLTELGGGWYGRLHNSPTYWQVFAGLGLGRFSIKDDGRSNTAGLYSREHIAHVTRFFVQPALQIRLSAHATASLSSRVSFLLFNRIRTNYTPQEQASYLLDNLEGDGRVFWEPAIVNNFGFKKLPGLRAELQLGFASLVSRRFIDYRTLNISVGLVADLKQCL